MRNFYLIPVLLFTLHLSAQKQVTTGSDINEQVLFNIGNDSVTAEEYIAVYNKNRNLGEDNDPKTPREYLDLYVNFKLKVHDAKEKGMDTADSFLREYNSYRAQLTKPYLSDRDVTEELIQEAYNRMQKDVRASHIMIAVPADADDEKVEEAKKEISDIHKKIINGADFSEMAEKHSADTYSAKRGGDLGYFTAFNMVYPFESAVYDLKIGEISEPVRTKFGFHLIKKTDERPARATIRVAHIMVVENEKTAQPERQNAEKKINEIYSQLEAGGDFAEMARVYSEDKSTAVRGGELPEFGINKMFPEFEEVAFALENPGDYSKPFKTPIGWHIVKLIEKKPIPSFTEIKGQIKNSVERDSRSQQSHESVIKRLKLEYDYKEYPKVRKMAYDQVGDSYLQGKFSADKARNKDKVLLEFADQQFTVGDFLFYLEDNAPRNAQNSSLNAELRKAYEKYSEAQLIDYEKAHLEEKYPEFRMLSREYYEGILLFDLTEKKVWKKSVTDTTGLKQFYETHKTDYMWDTRYNVAIVKAADKKIAKKAGKMFKKGATVEEVEQKLNEDSELNVQIEDGLFEAEDKKELMNRELKTGMSDITVEDGRHNFIYIRSVEQARPKTLEEARGLVISDYQNYLEKEWIAELKQRYTVEMDPKVLEKVMQVLEQQG